MKASDKEQFLKQYLEIHESLMRFCIVKSRGIMDPKDLANDVLLVGLENYHKLENKGALLSYLFTTATRICLNKIRRRKFDGHYEEDQVENLEDPINNVDARVDIALLYTALDELPELQREAIVLFEISDLPIKEIMVIQNAGKSAVKQRIKRAREKLVELMHEKPQRKTVAAAAILFTSNSFSMTNLDAYFQIIKEIPLPLSSSEVTATVGNFQLVGTAVNTAASTIGSALIKKSIIGSAIVGTVIVASVLLSNNNDSPVVKETVFEPETTIDSVFTNPKQDEFIKTVNYADEISKYSSDIITINESTKKIKIESEEMKPIHENKLLASNLTTNTSALYETKNSTLIGDTYPSANVKTIYLKDLGDNVELKTWDRDEIKIIPNHIIEGKTPEDTKIIQNNIQYKVEKKGGILTISQNSCMRTKQKTRLGKKIAGTISFGNGEKAKFRNFELNYIVMLPASINLKITGAYRQLTIPEMTGGLTTRLYDTDLNLGSITGVSNLKLIHSKATMNQFEAATFYIVDSKINFNSATTLNLTANHSTINSKTISNATLVLLDSHLKSQSANKNLDGEIRYSTVEIENSAINESKLKAFDSQLSIPNITELSIELRYSTLTSQNIGSIYIPISFGSKVTIEKVKNLKGLSSKHTAYKIDELSNTIFLQSFEDELTLLKTELANMTFEGKYTTYNIKLASPANYTFDFDAKHSSLDYGNLTLTTEAYETQNEHQTINGYFESGGNEEASIKFKCYDSNITLK